MSVNAATVRRRPSRRALRALAASEGKLAWREPVGLVLGVGVPIMLLVIFGLSSGFQKRIVSTNPTTYRTVYVPILMGVKAKLPSAAEVVETARPVSWLVAVTFTPGTTAPDWSLTVP